MCESIGTYATSTKATWRGVYRVTQITDGIDTAAYNGSPNLYDPIELVEVEDYDVISVPSELRNRKG